MDGERNWKTIVRMCSSSYLIVFPFPTCFYMSQGIKMRRLTNRVGDTVFSMRLFFVFFIPYFRIQIISAVAQNGKYENRQWTELLCLHFIFSFSLDIPSDTKKGVWYKKIYIESVFRNTSLFFENDFFSGTAFDLVSIHFFVPGEKRKHVFGVSCELKRVHL